MTHDEIREFANDLRNESRRGPNHVATALKLNEAADMIDELSRRLAGMKSLDLSSNEFESLVRLAMLRRADYLKPGDKFNGEHGWRCSDNNQWIDLLTKALKHQGYEITYAR